MHTYYVYILQCRDGSYYTGLTNSRERRLAEHNSGFYPSAYTFKRRPCKLVFCQQFEDILQAIELEKQLKGWTRRKKEAFIAEEWEKLKAYSRNYTDAGKQASIKIHPDFVPK